MKAEAKITSAGLITKTQELRMFRIRDEWKRIRKMNEIKKCIPKIQISESLA
jgi:hypothetical protein